MYAEKRENVNIGEYDDYSYSGTGENENEGLLSPFTFLCFASVLILFALVMLFSSSYDTALRENSAFYSHFLRQSAGLVIGLGAGAGLSFVSERYIRKAYLVLFPAYIVLFILALSLKSYTPSYLYTSVMGEVGTLTLVFLLSDLAPMILSSVCRGVMLLILVALSLFILVTQALVSGPGWFILSFLVIISSLLSLKVKRSYVIYFSIVMLVTFAFLLLTSENMLSSFTQYLFPVRNEEWYSSPLHLSSIAIREGGVMGVGIGNGLYKLGLISDIEGEFIYASLSEETGVIGTLIILCSLFVIFVIGYRSAGRAYRQKEYFISSFTFAFTVFLSFSVLLNMLYVSGLFPFDGIPLLLFSYNPLNEALTAVFLVLLYRFIYRIGRENRE